jgi:lactoylglutathione lyase
MKLGYVTIRTRDLARSLEFYEKILGFRPTRRFSPRPGMEIAFLDDGSGGQVEFIQGGPDQPFSGSGIALGFNVPDIDATAAMLKAAGVEPSFGPLTMPNGVRLLGAKDPNGLDLGFSQEG